MGPVPGPEQIRSDGQVETAKEQVTHGEVNDEESCSVADLTNVIILSYKIFEFSNITCILE